MNNILKKAAAVLMCAVTMVGFCACGKDAKKEDAPITSNWKFDHMLMNNEEILPPKNEQVLIPQFSSDDGTHFRFSITGTDYMEGNLTKIDDKTYSLRYGESDSIFDVTIEGDELIVNISKSEEENTSLVFKVQPEAEASEEGS